MSHTSQLPTKQTQRHRKLLNVYDGRFDHPDQKSFLQEKMEFVVGMTNNLKVIDARRMMVIIAVAMLVHCSSSVLIIGVRITSQNGHP